MSKHVRVSSALAGSTPFIIGANGSVTFDGRSGREVEYGHCFDDKRGYRVYFCFKDSPIFKNTWGGESLARYADKIIPKDDGAKQLQTDCRRLARQVSQPEWTAR